MISLTASRPWRTITRPYRKIRAVLGCASQSPGAFSAHGAHDAGSMPVVKGRGLTASAWEKLIKEFEIVAKKERVRGEQSTSLGMVLAASFDALAQRKQEEFLKIAVLAPGAVARIEMLLNLWELQDAEGTREEAEGLVGKCLLQNVGGDEYRVHDLILEFMKINIKAEVEMLKGATALQAQYLGRLDVVKSYRNSELDAGSQGILSLAALWRSLEELSGDCELETTSYRASLGALEACEATADVANSYLSVGILFELQGKFNEADALLLRVIAIQESTLGPDHPELAASFNERANVLGAQGKYVEAEPLFERAAETFDKALGPDHPDVAVPLTSRARLLGKQGKYEEANPLFLRAITTCEKTLGPGHPDLATTLNEQARLRGLQGKYKEADVLLLQVIAIQERNLGPDHPMLATSINERAIVLEAQGKYVEAEPLYERAAEIFDKASGPDH
ncbi:unnamed protein product [Pylaiella littoralis]